jgi:cytochrome b
LAPWALAVKDVTITTASKTDPGTAVDQEVQNKTQIKTLIWDLPTRGFHWALVICLTGSWVTAELGFEWTETHFILGYTSLGLIVFRIIWGFIGPAHARFSAFLRGPASVMASARQLTNRNPSSYVGHNPIGGWSTLLFLIVVAVQATTGLFISDDIFYAGPYNGVVSSSTAGELAGIHHLNFNLLQGLVVVHLAAIFWYQWGKRTNLIAPMVSGYKQLSPDEARQAIPHLYVWRGLLLGLITAAAITALVQLAPPPAPIDFY